MKIIEGFDKAKSILSRQIYRIRRWIAMNRRKIVRQIVNDVRDRGDAALFDYTEKFDGVKLTSLEVSKKAINQRVP